MIRAIAAGDVQAVTAIYNHYVTHTTVSFEEQPITAQELAARIDKVCSAGFSWLVAEQEGRIVGYAYASYWHTRPAYKRTVELTVYLAPEHAGEGWGSQLYAALFDSLRHTEVHVVMALIALPNPASVALHEKFGMKKVGHLLEVGRKFDQWIDVGFWQAEVDSCTP